MNNPEAVIGFHVTNILLKNKITDRLWIPEYIRTRCQYCIACGSELEFQSDEPKSCGSTACLYAVEEILFGDYVTQLCKEEPYTAVLHLFCTIQALNSHKASTVLEPYPLYFLKEKISLVRGSINALRTNVAYQNIPKLNELLPHHTGNLRHLTEFVTKWSKFPSDKALCEELGHEKYRFIRFIFMSNKTKLTVSTNYKELDWMTDHAIFFQVPPNPIIDNEWTTPDLFYHGSCNENWYSIMRNGLIPMSNTSLQAHGAAFGQGIYLSSDYTYSHAYSSHNGPYIMGLFQVKKDKHHYHRNANIYVVPETKDVLLRAILFYPSHSTHVNTNTLTFDQNTLQEYLNEQANKKKQSSSNVISKHTNSKASNRLMKEFQLMKSNTSLGFSFELQEDNLYKWLIKLDRSKFEDSNSLLVQDMKRLNVQEIKLEMLFEDNFPYSPPFLRVISPIFKPQSGHITISGSICMELLCTGHWSPATSIESLIIQIKVLILEGEGRLDESKLNLTYSLKDAKEAFIRVAKSHGWL